MTLRSRRVAMLSALAAVAVAAGYFATRRPDPETCFDRLGGPGPNSNTPRLDTYLEIPANQWPAVAQILRQFAAERGWLLSEYPSEPDPNVGGMDLCDHVTIVRADSTYMGSRQIGFGIIHMDYEGPADLAWRPHYRDLHQRLEARWPGRMRYIEGEFGQRINRPDWLDVQEGSHAAANQTDVQDANAQRSGE